MTYQTIRRSLMGSALCGAVLVGVWGVARTVEAGDKTVGTVSFVQGSAQRARGGDNNWKALTDKTALFQGDRLKTGDATRLEATLNDGSKLRLAANSELNLERVEVSKKKDSKTVQAKLFFGRMWASVTKLVGSDSKFEVSTANAVAGVRGTRFEAAADSGGKTTVRVFSGRVLVSNQPIYAVKGHTKATRVEVAGPQEVSKKQWDELVAGAMQMITVAANGEMTQPETFAAADPAADDWEAWNAERDKVAGLTE